MNLRTCDSVSVCVHICMIVYSLLWRVCTCVPICWCVCVCVCVERDWLLYNRVTVINWWECLDDVTCHEKILG